MFLKIRRWSKDESGVAATEFALIVPLLSLLLLGILDFGLYINQQMKIENAARASAEYIMRGGSADDIQTNIISQIVENDNGITVTTTSVCECGDGVTVDCDAPGDCADGYARQYQEVRLNQTYDAIFGFPGLTDNLELSGAARVQVQ